MRHGSKVPGRKVRAHSNIRLPLRLEKGQSLAQEIPSSEIDLLAYVNPVNEVFSFQRINVLKVIKLLKAIDVSKATGLDKIPNRLLKIAADVVAPSLTGIFNQSLVTGIFPSDWKMA